MSEHESAAAIADRIVLHARWMNAAELQRSIVVEIETVRARQEERMRLHCHFCGKSVSNEVPADTVLRAVACCPECLEAGRVVLPEHHEQCPWHSADPLHLRSVCSCPPGWPVVAVR